MNLNLKQFAQAVVVTGATLASPAHSLAEQGNDKLTSILNQSHVVDARK